MKNEPVIRNSRVVTAGSEPQYGIGALERRIVTPGIGLAGTEVIEATGLITMHDGRDSHVHISQHCGPGIEMADDVAAATRVAACPAKAEGPYLADLSFHPIARSVDPVTLGLDLPALIAQDMTSFKDLMTYKGMCLTGAEIPQITDAGLEQGALTRVHAENQDGNEFLRDTAERAGRIQPLHRGLAVMPDDDPVAKPTGAEIPRGKQGKTP